MNSLSEKFDFLILVCVCVCVCVYVFSKHDFVTAGGNIQVSYFNYLCIIDEKTSKRVNRNFFAQ